MNLENFKKLRDQLARLPDEKFKMDNWIKHEENCGTVACIAGWCSLLNGGPNEHVIIGFSKSPPKFAAEFLGLPNSEAHHLFHGDWSKDRLEKITRQDAIAFLDYAIKKYEQDSNIRFADISADYFEEHDHD